MLDIALPQAVRKTVVQGTQFQIAVHFNVVHIVFFISDFVLIYFTPL